MTLKQAAAILAAAAITPILILAVATVLAEIW